MHGLIQDLEDGYVKRIAFVVPPGASWPLPIYELALMTAARAFDMCVDVELTLVTPEPSPLAFFGEEVSQDVAAAAGRGRDRRQSRCGRRDAAPQRARAASHGERLDVDRVVTLPILAGPRSTGSRMTPAGFLPVDAHGRVHRSRRACTPPAMRRTSRSNRVASPANRRMPPRRRSPRTPGVAIEPTPFAPVLRGLPADRA